MENTDIKAMLRIPDHPFYTGLISPSEDQELPDSLPFALGVHPKYAIPRLVVTDDIRKALSRAYSLGSMASTPLGESSLSVARMTEVLNQLLHLFKGSIVGKRFLEIGCGNGELLNQLKLKGANVVGLEIGPQAQIVHDRYGIRVLRDPLVVGSLDEKFDCVYSYGCLEHIEELDQFFAASRECLYEGGLFFHSVPNAALSFHHAHADHLLHEHLNYFTPKNGVALLKAQGFRGTDFKLTKAENELMLWGFHQNGLETNWPIERFNEEEFLLYEYAERFEKKRNIVLKALDAIIEAGQTIGFYAGGYEYSFLLKSNFFRYFDGDTYKHGKKWLRGLRAIEPPRALLSHPVDHLIICKSHYESAIRHSLIDLGVDESIMKGIDSLG